MPRVLNLVPALWQLNLDITESSNLSPSMTASSIPTEPCMANTLICVILIREYLSPYLKSLHHYDLPRTRLYPVSVAFLYPVLNEIPLNRLSEIDST